MHFLYYNGSRKYMRNDSMSKTMTIRLTDVHSALLDKMVEKLKEQGVKTNKTDVIEKALFFFARESILSPEEISEIIDEHYMGFN